MFGFARGLGPDNSKISALRSKLCRSAGHTSVYHLPIANILALLANFFRITDHVIPNPDLT